MNLLKLLTLFTSIVVVYTSCSDSTSGTTSNTENSIVALTIRDQQGSPVSARISLRTLDYVSPKISEEKFFNVHTLSDSSGHFNFYIPDSIPDSLFFISSEIYDGSKIVGISWDTLSRFVGIDSVSLKSPLELKIAKNSISQNSTTWLIQKGSNFQAQLSNNDSSYIIPPGKHEFSLFSIQDDSVSFSENTITPSFNEKTQTVISIEKNDNDFDLNIISESKIENCFTPTSIDDFTSDESGLDLEADLILLSNETPTRIKSINFCDEHISYLDITDPINPTTLFIHNGTLYGSKGESEYLIKLNEAQKTFQIDASDFSFLNRHSIVSFNDFIWTFGKSSISKFETYEALLGGITTDSESPTDLICTADLEGCAINYAFVRDQEIIINMADSFKTMNDKGELSDIAPPLESNQVISDVFYKNGIHYFLDEAGQLNAKDSTNNYHIIGSAINFKSIVQ